MVAELDRVSRGMARRGFLIGAEDVKSLNNRLQQVEGIPPDLIDGDRLQPDETIGKWLKRACDRRGLSQRQLGDFSGIDHSAISRIFADKSIPSLYGFAKIVDFLDIAPEIVYDAMIRAAKQEKSR